MASIPELTDEPLEGATLARLRRMPARDPSALEDSIDDRGGEAGDVHHATRNPSSDKDRQRSRLSPSVADGGFFPS